MFEILKKAEEIAQKAKDIAENTTKKCTECIPDEIIDIKDKVIDSAGEMSEKISDKLLDSHLEEIESYCSWCFEKHKCTIKEKNNITRNIYICDGCGKEVVKCRIAKCNNKAKYSNNIKEDKEDKKDKENIGLWSNSLCAVHEGIIAKFETLNWSLDSIGEYRDILGREEKNWKKIGTTAAFTTAGVAVIAPLALMAAPAIGGVIGVSFFELSGAAATSAGLATLGGGSLAAGGLGMGWGRCSDNCSW